MRFKAFNVIDNKNSRAEKDLLIEVFGSSVISPASSTNSTYLIEVLEQDISKPNLAFPDLICSNIASSFRSKT